MTITQKSFGWIFLMPFYCWLGKVKHNLLPDPSSEHFSSGLASLIWFIIFCYTLESDYIDGQSKDYEDVMRTWAWDRVWPVHGSEWRIGEWPSDKTLSYDKNISCDKKLSGLWMMDWELGSDLAGVGRAVGEAGGALVQLHLIRGYEETRIKVHEETRIQW